MAYRLVKLLSAVVLSVFMQQSACLAKSKEKLTSDKSCDCSCEDAQKASKSSLKSNKKAAAEKTLPIAKPAPEVVMYSRDGCNFCVLVKKSLSRRGIEVIEKDVTNPAVLKELRSRVQNARSVPQIFIGNEYIGGYSEFNVLDRDGQINEMLGFKTK